MDLVDICRIFHPTTSHYSQQFTHFLSSSWKFLQNTSYPDKKYMPKYKKIAIMSSIFSDHNRIKLKSVARETTQDIQTHAN
jgi:hypothetical protein